MSRRALVVVTRPGDALGFRLAGARVEEVAPGEEAERLGPIFASTSAGVIAIAADVLPAVPAVLLEKAARAGVPVVFPFLVPRQLRDGGEAESYVGLLVRRAIGFHVRLR